MYKKLFSTIILIVTSFCANAQLHGIDSIKHELDTIHINFLLNKASSFFFTKPDSCLQIANQALVLANKLNFSKGEVSALNMAGEALRFLGKLPQALEMQFKALQITRSNNDKKGEAISLGFIGLVYTEIKEFRQALYYLFQAKEIYKIHPVPISNCFNLSNIGNAYKGMNMPDSALFFQNLAESLVVDLPHGNLKILILRRLGSIHNILGKYEEALQYYNKGLISCRVIGDKVNPSVIQFGIAEIFLKLNQEDSSLFYARQAYRNAQNVSQKLQILDASNLLVELFRKGELKDSVIHYQDIAIAINDSLFGPEKHRQLQLFTLQEQQRKQEILQEQIAYKNKTRINTLLAMIVFFLIIAIMLFQNNRQTKKVNLKIEKAYEVLQKTQSQLIQSEKMASLGELTAGIAHEIQNPLNFVNNFSELNSELIDELTEEIEKQDYHEAKTIAKDIKENEQKINHHGKRADAIVKSMLEHSRISSGEKQPTDINALADEYFRLAYHGLRAKDKSFNSAMETDFDPEIGMLDIIPQEIGRVILNLVNNAFQAVSEQKVNRRNDSDSVVKLSTKKLKDKIQITVKDNGNGISKTVLDKIFQPFFTTKPSGLGTGLGLSLSYDIVKAHGGELEVKTKEGEGSEFIISLPVR